jgi:hypothetical protein
MSLPKLETARPIEAVVREALGVDFNLNKDDVEAIANVALTIAQQQIREGAALGFSRDLRSLVPYQERSAGERAALCAHVLRVMQALVALGWIARPN